MYYSIFDRDTNSYLHTGRNSKLKSTAIREWVLYFISGNITEAYEKLLKRLVKNKKWKALEQELEECYFSVLKHKQRL